MAVVPSHSHSGVVVGNGQGGTPGCFMRRERAPGDRYANGVIDELAVYNRALTGSEIRDLSVVPVPGAALLGVLGLSFAGWRLRRLCR